MAVALGNLGGPVLATVDADGRVRVAGATWALDWFVRGDDGWLLPRATRPRLSQRRVDGTPVVETAIRIGRGETVHRAFVGRTASGVDAVVVEIENRGAAPIGVALSVAGGSRIDLDDRRLVVDGHVALSLPRPPARSAASLAEILGDGGTPSWPGPIRARRGRAEAAIVFPLAHTARLRVVAGADVAPDQVPAAERVVAGWSAHLGAGLRLDLPDAGVAAEVRADLADLLLSEPLDAATDAEAVLALDRFGHHGPAGRALSRAIDEQRLHREDGAPLTALAEHWRLTGGGDPEAAAGVVAAAAHRARRTGGPAVQIAAADLLDAAGQPEAAALCRERAAAAERSRPSAGVGATTPARRLLALRDVLVADTVDGLTIVPVWPDEWLGRGVEVHGARTRWGRLGFAVRWHGPRPALLWEHEGGDGVVVRTGLDPAWSTTAARGEALLAAVEPAGGLPKVVTPLPEPGTPVDEAAAEGEGFT